MMEVNVKKETILSTSLLVVMALFICVVTVIIFFGMNSSINTQLNKAEKDKTVLRLLPPNTNIVEDLGNKWYIVEINKKKFLFGYWHGSHGEQGFTITQLRSSEFLPHLELENDL